MSNIRVDINETIKDGSELIFIAPSDCTEITKLAVYHLSNTRSMMRTLFDFKDAHGNVLANTDLFKRGVYVKVILNVTEGIAYIQNADTNKYLENRFDHIVTQDISMNRKSGTTKGVGSTSLGLNCEASGPYSHAEGESSVARTTGSHAEGKSTQAGENANGQSYTHSEGVDSKAFGRGSHAEGESTEAIGQYSHAEGGGCIARGDYSHVEGCNFGNAPTKATGKGAHAEGHGTWATNEASHSEGQATNSNGVASHSEGKNTTASGNFSHAEGFESQATNSSSHAEGYNTRATGDMSHAEGNNTKARGTSQHVQGKFNIEDTEEKYAHIVGGGTSDTDRKNIHTLDWEGNAEFAGDVTATDEEGNKISLKQVKENTDSPTYTVATSLTNLVSGEKLSVAFGKIAKAVKSLISHLADYNNPHKVTAKQVGALTKSDVVDNLESDSEDLPLSAKQGKILKNKQFGCYSARGSDSNFDIPASTVTIVPLTQHIVHSSCIGSSGESNGFELNEKGGVIVPFNGHILVSGCIRFGTHNTQVTRGCYIKHSYMVDNKTEMTVEVGSQYITDQAGKLANISSGTIIVPVSDGDVIYLCARSSEATRCDLTEKATQLNIAYINYN